MHVRPLDPDVHEQLGSLLLAEGRPAEALEEFRIVLAQGAYDQANAYFQIARAHNALGDVDATRDNLLTALDIAPGTVSTPAYQNPKHSPLVHHGNRQLLRWLRGICRFTRVWLRQWRLLPGSSDSVRLTL